MKSYNVSRLPSIIELGYDGENNWRPNAFDCSPLLANHPNGTISLWLLPHGETQAFPVALERDGNTVIWTPLSEEMTAATGALQLVCTDGTDVGKSAVVLFRVDESIIPGAEHPAAVPSWATQTIERAENAAGRAEEAAERIDVEHLEQTIAAAVEAYLIEHPIEAPVQTVNGKTGAVVLGASDVGALPDDTVIPVVPQMATQTDMSDWTSGKTVDAATLKANFQQALTILSNVGDAVDDQNAAIVRLEDDKADKTEIPTKTSDLTNDSGYQTASDVQTAISGKADKTPRVAMASTDTTPTLDPNKLYVFPEMVSLAPTLAAPSDSSIANEYHFIFTSGTTATTLTIPATINQPDGFTVEANHVYEVSVMENNMTAQGWAVSA